MAFVLADRVKETSTTIGTGTYDLAGAVPGFRTFVAGIGTGNETWYFATNGTDWETGRGTVTDAAPDTLARTAIFESSNGDAAVNWGAGTKTIRCGLPGSRMLPTVEGQALIAAAGLAPTWANRVTSKTVQATTSGTAKDFTGIPPSARRIEIIFDGVSFDGGTDWLIIQLGDAAGFETTGYSSWSTLLQSAGNTPSLELTNGLVIYIGAASTLTGKYTLYNITGNRWIGEFTGQDVGVLANVIAGGSKTLSDTLTQVRVTRDGSTNAFDAGQINVVYQ